jgi:Tfp pilus assembly protein PilV
MKDGFTFIEVLAILLVVSLGLFTIVGILAVAQRLSFKALAQSTGMATAVTVAADLHPWLDPTASDWIATDPDLDAPSYAVNASGFVNGWYVERQEVSATADIVATDAVTNHVILRSAQVQVQVYETVSKTQQVTGYVTRILRQRGTP